MKRAFLGRDTLHRGDVTEGQLSPSFVIVCPICGFDYNWLVKPDRQSGWEPIQQGEEITYRWSGRAGFFRLPIEGECGHRWAICLHFHKGQLFMVAVDDSDRGWEGVPGWALQALETDSDEGGGSQ